MDSFFRSIKAYPDRQDANGVVMRLLDGVGYRFYWATEGLTAADYRFTPGEGCQSIGELVAHVWGLANWVLLNLNAPSSNRPDDPADIRIDALDKLEAIRNHVRGLDEQALFQATVDGHPFWHMINGPLSDAISHTGQIASFRRLNGNPVPNHHVFLCHEKEEEDV